MSQKTLVLAARIILGGGMVVFGLNGFLQFLPSPEMPVAGLEFLTALMRTGYFFPLLKFSEIIAGAMVLSGYLLPLGLLILAPILLQILLFHIFLAPGIELIALPIVFVICELYLAQDNMDVFSPILKK
jgi:putative oxidoreductase